MKKKEKTSSDNSKVIAEKIEETEDWIEQNPKTVTVFIGIILLVSGGYFGFRYYIDTQNEIAQRDFFQAVRYFESDSLSLALEGDGNSLGMNQIIDEYGFTKTQNLANFYAGVIHLKKGDFEMAIASLKEFDLDDMLVQARTYSLMGDAYMELEDYKNAAVYYDKAASHNPNKVFTPTYLMKEALAYEKLNQLDHAKKIYQQIIDDYWESAEYSNARKFQAKITVK